MKRAKVLLLTLLVVAVYLLHQDFWNWKQADPLVFGFLPIGLAKSTVGEYTFAIFAVTAASLVISWLVSVYFVPYLGALLLKAKPAAEGEVHELFDTPFYTRFRGVVRCVCVVSVG